MQKNFCSLKNLCIFAISFGKMAERSNAAVLKTVDLHGSGGSNPSLSAGSCQAVLGGSCCLSVFYGCNRMRFSGFYPI